MRTTCSLRFDQIHTFADGASQDPADLQIMIKDNIDLGSLPAEITMKNTVLFSRPRLQAIHQRTAALEAENRAERANFKELHRVKNRLERAKQSQEAQIVQLQSKCDDLQMLKCAKTLPWIHDTKP
mmetsp:Transcript_4399/g.13950  ORF Transcript_4399/g.13950 Transcript_4399/m.13950 type:complete len:126 (-) Transcript_4399:786-1163(-)